MKTERIKDRQYYMELPYTIVIRADAEGDFVARVEELPGCSSHGHTEAEAIDAVREAQQLWIDDAIEAGHPVPEPEPEEQLPSGRWVQRTPRTLHAGLTRLAKREGVSLNQLVTSLLSSALAAKTMHDQWTAWIGNHFSELSRRSSPSKGHVWDVDCFWGRWEKGYSFVQAKLHGVVHRRDPQLLREHLENVQKLKGATKWGTDLPDAYADEIEKEHIHAET